MTDRTTPPAPGQIDRRTFVQGAAAGAAALAFGTQAAFALQDVDKGAVLAQIPRQHDTTLQMLREWIALPSIAAEGLNYPQGADYMAKLARDAGFQHVEVMPTAGKPGVFATMDVGAKNWLGIYFMYDVKQYDPAEWSSPPLEGRLVERPGLGKVIVGRGATNTKGPQTAVLGIQHVIAMFGATVLAPLLMGFDPNVAILMSGVGTLVFFLAVGGRVPSYLGSSFAFIGVVYPNPKNLYLRVLAVTGILGMVVYLALQASLLGEAVAALRRGAASWRFLGMAALCTWFALFFYNMTQDSFATPNLWLNLGILAGVAGQDHRAGS